MFILSYVVAGLAPTWGDRKGCSYHYRIWLSKFKTGLMHKQRSILSLSLAFFPQKKRPPVMPGGASLTEIVHRERRLGKAGCSFQLSKIFETCAAFLFTFTGQGLDNLPELCYNTYQEFDQ